MNNDLVSIIIPCFNQGAFLDETLLSVYNQTYSNWECIIVNDGSTDNSENIATVWLEKDKRFKYYYKENSGVSATRNFALEKVTGTYIQFLDADDVLDSRKLELSLKGLKDIKCESKKIVISNFRMFSIESSITKEPYCSLHEELFTFQSLLYKWNETFSIPIHCGFFEAVLFDNIRFFENLTAQEDWIVWVKLFKLNPNVIFLDQPLALYRQNIGGRTMTKSFLDDQIKAYAHLKDILNESEFNKLSVVLISRYYRIQEEMKKRLGIVKKSGPYQTGLMIKKVLKTLRLLKIFRKLFPFFLKLKSK
ncbi:glycosyltransferase family 2 protein [Thalassobellus sediminis]|uniref:glycosyltransferase family 2 protein n=1 Tax=Thalassobellus sediminis TaxID=3367753 RepID=UPI0037A3616D